MEHVVRPVWIALAGTAVPPDLKGRCRQFLEHIRKFFSEKVGTTFQVAELVVIQTHHTADYFQKRRDTPLPRDLDQIGRERGGLRYYSKLSVEEIFCLNLIVFAKQKLGTDNSQAWIILVPAVAMGSWGGTYSAIQIGSGGYTIISAYPLYPWGSDERTKIRIAHELGHIFGLDHDREAPHGLMNDQRLLYDQNPMLADCILNQKERWILSRSSFFTEEEL